MTGILIREAKGGEKEEKAVRRGKQISQGVLVPPVATRSQERPERSASSLRASGRNQPCDICFQTSCLQNCSRVSVL